MQLNAWFVSISLHYLMRESSSRELTRNNSGKSLVVEVDSSLHRYSKTLFRI